MNKLEHLAASVSAVALLSSAASAAVTLPDGAHVMTAEEIALLPVQRDMNRQREFIIVLKPETAGSADAVEAYFRGFGFATEYWPDMNVVKLLGSFFQAERAGNFTYIAGRDPLTPLTINRKPSFSDPTVQGAVLVTTMNPGPVMRSYAFTPSNPTTLPNRNGVFGLAPSDYANIYGYRELYRAGFKGQTETVDIAACFGFSSSSLTNYESIFGISPKPNVKAVTTQHGDSLEADLAVQRVYGTAPGAAIRMFFSQTCTLNAFTGVFFEIAHDQARHPAAAFTIPYGLPELQIARSFGSSFFTAADAGLAAITGGAKQKVALFAPSGDNGDFSIYDRFFFSQPVGQTDVAFFASDPNVLAVGGTNLVLSKTFTRAVETAWSGSQLSASTFTGRGSGGGSGGGISNVFKLPPWQKGVAGTFSQTFKNLPDVSSNASQNSPALFVLGSSIVETGGTSAAAPTWAGTVALLQQEFQKAHHGAKLTNWPAFFYNKTTRANMFTDITDGTNGFFRAGPGYDNVTGLGVPCFLHFPKPCVNGK
jgi:subtilase family serine protease